MTEKSYIFKYTNRFYTINNDPFKGYYEFKLPQKEGSSSAEVEILKLYLGLDTQPGETGATFDTQLINRLRIWQNDHLEDIAAESGANVRVDPSFGLFDIDLGVAYVFEEQGYLGDATYKALMNNGFAAAAKEYFESEYWASTYLEETVGTLMSSDYEFPTQNDEVQQEPTFVGEWVQYKYVTNYGKHNIEGEMSERDDILLESLRAAVLEVFNFYGKPTTWVIDGAPQPELLEQTSLYKSANDLVKVYEKILQRAQRLPAGGTFREDQRFTMTVEDPGSLYEQLNGEKVDAIYNVPLSGYPDPFCYIKEISPPSLRPTSTYNIVVMVSRKVLEGIEGGNIGFDRIGGTFDVTNPDNWRKADKLYEDSKAKAKELYGKANRVLSDLKDPGKMARQVDKFAKGQQRKAGEAVRNLGNNLWDQARTGQGGGFGDPASRQAATQERLKNAAELRDTPGLQILFLNEIKDRVEKVAAKIEEYHEDIQRFKDENSSDPSSRFEKVNNPIIPDLDPREEARKLREVLVGLDQFLKVNGYSLNSAGPSSNSNLELQFEPVEGVVFAPKETDPSLSPNLDEVSLNPTSEGYNTTIGFRISDIKYYVNEEGEERPLPSARQRFEIDSNRGKKPFIYPTTMGYLGNLEEIYDWIQENPCDDLSSGNPAVLFFSRWHWPQPSFNFTSKKSESIINITEPSLTLATENADGERKERTVKNLVDLKSASILTARDEYNEQKALLSDNLKAIKESTLFQKRGKVIRTGDVYPEFGKIPCDIEEMWEQFLNQWDMKLVMCDLQKCIPQLPRFNFDFNWKLPVLPNIPTFDPMHFVLPQLKISINDIILSFICKLIKSILDLVRRPDCTELLGFGLVMFDQALELSRAIKDARRGNDNAPLQERADAVGKANETLNAMGVVGPELSADTGNLLQNISAVLTPTEFCSLFEGRASDNVLNIVLKVVQASTSTLKEYLNTIEKVEKFFYTLGTVVDPEICEAIKELSDIVISQQICRDDNDLRSMLENSGATEEQIRSEIDALNTKRKILNDLSKQGDFSGLLPGMSPAQLAEAGLPGPYNNPFANKMAKYGASSIFTNLKTYYSIEASAFPSKFIEEIVEMIEPGAPGFSPLHYAKFIYYKKLAEDLADNIERDPEYLPEKVGTLLIAPGATFVNFRGELRVARDVYVEEYGIEEKYLPFIKYLPTPGDRVEDLAEFADLVEQHVVGYMEQYSKIRLVVTQTLKHILESDVSTMVRKFPNLKNSLRELHIRLATERTEVEPFDLSGLTKASAGTSIGITELPFYDNDIKDCYRFSYDIRSTRDIITKTYHETIPQEYVEFRSEGADIISQKHRDKLLRPGGFATLLVKKYTELADDSPGANSFTVYSEDNDSNILPKILGYIDSPDLDQAREVFNSVMNSDDTEGNSLGELLLALIAGAIAAAGEISETSNGQPLYSSVVDSFNFQLSDLTKNSKFFNVDAMLELEDSLSTEYGIERECYVKNNSTLDFQMMVEKFAEKFNQKISESKHDPTKRDFNLMGPYEEAAIESLFKTYTDFYCLEMMFKNIFLLSEVGAKRIFKSEFVIDYIVESIAAEMQGSLFSRTNITKFNEILKTITKLDDPKESIKTLVVKNLDVEEMSSFIDEIYQPKYSSFKERVYNELVDNIKDVPSVGDYPKVTVLSDFTNLDASRTNALEHASFLDNYGGFQDIPVSARLPNLYDKFRFEGYSEELIQKKINSGHFWVERFYRIDNFSEFKSKYNQIQRYVNTNPAYNRLQPLSSMHEEYISPEDMETMLFGYKSFEELERYNETINKNLNTVRIEYEYIRYVFLSFLSNFYTDGSYKEESLASKVMIDLGMAEMSEETLSRKLRTWSGPLGSEDVLHVVDTRPYDSEWIETDLAYRRGTVTIQDLYSRMETRFRIGKEVSSGNIEGDVPISKTWQTIPDENKYDTGFGSLAKHYDWVNFFDVFVPGAGSLSIERKSQLIVDCLTRFVELSHNWVTRRQSAGAAAKFTPVWRDLGEIENSGYSENKFETLLIVAKVGSAFYSRKYGQSAGLAASTWYSNAKSTYQASSDALLNEQWTDTFYHFTQPDTNDRDVAGSVVYEPGDKYQDMILSLYVSEVFSPTAEVSYEESRVGILNLASSGFDVGDSPLADINIPGFGSVNQSLNSNSNSIFSKQAELYNHLKNNLKVGCRLMFGHKVLREEINFKGEGVNRIHPKNIFKDFSFRDGTTGMGLPNKAGIFSIKKAFLGHADREPLMLGVQDQGSSLNSRSAFYSNAMRVVGSRNAGLFATHLSPEVLEKSDRIDRLVEEISAIEQELEEYIISTGSGFSDAIRQTFAANMRSTIQAKRSEMQALETQIREIVSVRIATDDDVDLITPEIENVLVYSIPMDEYVMDVDCFEELFAEFEEKEKTKVNRTIEQIEQRLEELQEQNEEASQEALEQIILDAEERLSNLNERLSWYIANNGPMGTGADLGGPWDAQIRLKRKEIADTEASLALARGNPEAFYDQQTTERIQELTDQNNTWKESVEFEGFFRSGENRTSTTGKLIRRNFLRTHLFEKYNDKIVSELLSMNKQANGKWTIDPNADPMKPHKMLFDFLFPLDRYAPLHFLQNLEVFQNEKGDVNILKATKLFILQHMLQMHGIGSTTEKPEDSEVDNSHALLTQNVGAEGMTVTEIMEMIWEAIVNAAKDAASAAVREIVKLIDPGYRDMRRGYLKDPCAMKEGLKRGLVGQRSVTQYSGGNLDEGFGKRQGCKYFVPVNNFPSDLFEGAVDLDFKRVRDASLNFAGLLQNKKKRYGLPMTYLSDLAFEVREVKGEKHSRLKRKNNCEDDCKTKPIVTPKGKCEDK